MTLAGNDYFVALDQLFCALALAVGAGGIARRFGFGRREALFGGLLVLTLPLIALQAGTAMSDLVVAAFLLAAALFLIDGNRVSPWLAGVATALAVDVKLTTPIALPFLLGSRMVRSAGRAQDAATRRGRRRHCGRSLLVRRQSMRDRLWDNHIASEYSVDRGLAPVASRTHADRRSSSSTSRAQPAAIAGSTGSRPLVVLVVAVVSFLRARTRGTLVAGGIAAARRGPSALAVAVRASAHSTSTSRSGTRSVTAISRTSTAAATSRSRRRTSPGTARSDQSCSSPRRCSSFVEVRRRRLDRMALVSVIAPAYWLVAFAALLFYQDWIGRFFAFPIALAAATWGIVFAGGPSPGAWSRSRARRSSFRSRTMRSGRRDCSCSKAASHAASGTRRAGPASRCATTTTRRSAIWISTSPTQPMWAWRSRPASRCTRSSDAGSIVTCASSTSATAMRRKT